MTMTTREKAARALYVQEPSYSNSGASPKTWEETTASQRFYCFARVDAVLRAIRPPDHVEAFVGGWIDRIINGEG